MRYKLTHLSTSIPFRPFATMSYKNCFSFVLYVLENEKKTPKEMNFKLQALN